MKKNVKFTTKLNKHMKVIWRQYKTLIVESFGNNNSTMALFIPLKPEYAIQFMTRIRMLLCKLLGSIESFTITPSIRPEEGNTLGILITKNE